MGNPLGARGRPPSRRSPRPGYARPRGPGPGTGPELLGRPAPGPVEVALGVSPVEGGGPREVAAGSRDEGSRWRGGSGRATEAYHAAKRAIRPAPRVVPARPLRGMIETRSARVS